MMKLVIDIGNTSTKTGIFQKDELLQIKNHETLTLKDLEKIFSQFPDISYSILSSVIHHDTSIDDWLKDKTVFFDFSYKLLLPIKIKYQTPDTLGKDRLAAAIAGNHLYPGNNVLIIMAGTCITYDIVTSEKHHLGGGISPGLSMRLKSLNHFTGKLPLIEKSDKVDFIGRNTHSSILSGVFYGALTEIDGVISRYCSEFKNLKVILSGGDAKYFDKKLKNNIFAIPNIVLLGLNVILDFNAN